MLLDSRAWIHSHCRTWKILHGRLLLPECSIPKCSGRLMIMSLDWRAWINSNHKMYQTLVGPSDAITAGVSHPELFKKIGDYIAGLGNLDSFNSQDLSNTAWAYATARQALHFTSFWKLVTEASVQKDDFVQTQHIANFLWACACAHVCWLHRWTIVTWMNDGYTDERLFSAFATVIESKLDAMSNSLQIQLGRIWWPMFISQIFSIKIYQGMYFK